MLTDYERQRLVESVRSLRRTPYWADIFSFHLSEASQDEPNYRDLHKTVSDEVKAMLLNDQHEAMRKYGKD